MHGRHEGLRIDSGRLLGRIAELAAVGSTPDGGCCRLAFTEEDRQGRDLLVRWMRDLGLEVMIDQIGNIIGMRAGSDDALAPVAVGSHIDTVATGGRLDGAYGVLAALEIVDTLNRHEAKTLRPLIVIAFSNEEGARFQPDMMGSLVWAGGQPLAEALTSRGIDGAILGEDLARIGYAGTVACGAIQPYAFLELHIEQGPVLDRAGGKLGAVADLQGISWQKVRVSGTSNHAGTTPMRLRQDAGHAAGEIIAFVRRLALEMGGAQVGTVGSVKFSPNLINVIAREASLTVDLRNTDETLLCEAEQRLGLFIEQLAEREHLKIEVEPLVRQKPVSFDSGLVEMITAEARVLGHEALRMTSGAGHDAQMMARICRSAMIFVPSINGISHNPREHTEAADLVLGADLLMRVLLRLTSERDSGAQGEA